MDSLASQRILLIFEPDCVTTTSIQTIERNPDDLYTPRSRSFSSHLSLCVAN